MTKRRDFLTSLTLAAATIALDKDEALAESRSSAWDTSWIDSLAKAKYRVVFNGSDVADGIALDYASTFLDNFHEVHDTQDTDTRPVIVFRRLGTVMALNHAMWERYAIGADRKVDDPLTKAPATRNPFWSRGGDRSGTSIESLQKRGLICLACNVSLGSMGYTFAQKTGRPVEEVRKELRENLIPGGIAVPSGIFALIRAQNAGCAFMQGT